MIVRTGLIEPVFRHRVLPVTKTLPTNVASHGVSSVKFDFSADRDHTKCHFEENFGAQVFFFRAPSIFRRGCISEELQWELSPPQ